MSECHSGTMAKHGRPVVKAPDGRWTVAELAKELDLTYQGAYNYSKKYPCSRDDSGVITFADSVVAQIRAEVKARQKKEPHPDGRRGVMLRPDLDRYETWEKAAGDKAVSTWLGELADRAAKRVG